MPLCKRIIYFSTINIFYKRNTNCLFTKILYKESCRSGCSIINSVLRCLTTSPTSKLEYQAEANDVFVEFAAYPLDSTVGSAIADAFVLDKPIPKYPLGFIRKVNNRRHRITIRVFLKWQIKQGLDSITPLVNHHLWQFLHARKSLRLNRLKRSRKSLRPNRRRRFSRCGSTRRA